jgi:PAS domain S-box-containing protein
MIEAPSAVLDSLSDAVLVVESDGIVCHVNTAAGSLLGRDRSSLSGATLWSLFPELTQDRVRSAVERVVATGEPCRLDDAAGPSGQMLALHFALDRGRVWVVARARKRTQQAIEAERRKLDSLLDHAPFAVALFEGPDHRLVYSNHTNDEIAGRRFVGERLLDVFPEVAGQPYVALLDAVYQRGAVERSPELPARYLRDGQMYDGYFDVTHQPTFDEDGRITGVMSTSIEITEQVRARQEVEAARAASERASRLVDTIVSNATQGLVMMDAQQRCTFLNAAAESMFGLRLDQLRDRPLHEYVHHTRPDGTPYPIEECPIDRALPRKSQERGEDVFVHPEGYFYPVAFTASPIVQGGVAVGTVIELRDTTAEKEAERRLHAAISVRDEFLSIASHELRTPLTALGLQLGRLQRMIVQPGQPRTKEEEAFAVVMRQVERLEWLVEGLLDVSRIAAGHLELHVEPLDMAELVTEVVGRLSAIASGQRCTIMFEPTAPVRGTWDRERMVGVVTNLLSNAIKYGAGSPVVVRLESRGDHVVLEVRDKGIGISHKDQGRIFGRFERAVPSKNYGGLGLGLYIARQVVEAHGGSISVESTPGAGATFRVDMPRETQGGPQAAAE